MSPKNILNILDLAKVARERNEIFVPLFAGDAGLGKSQICQQWVKIQQKQDPNFGFIDLRLALLEAPDLIGNPTITQDAFGNTRTSFALPEMFPTSGSGLLLLEEPNRAKTDTLNGIMQLLTDRKIGKYELPAGWVIAACINDGDNYDVNTMDPALVNRFVSYNVNYDKKAFIEFIESKKWHANVKMFVKTIFEFVSVKDVTEGNKYISPRTLAQLNTVESTGLVSNKDMHFETVSAILGVNTGKAYHSMIFDDTAVLFKDIKKNRQIALEKLARHSDSDLYRGDMLTITTASILDNHTEIETELMAEILITLPKDVAASLFRSLCQKVTIDVDIKEQAHEVLQKAVRDYLNSLIKANPKLKEVLVYGKSR